MGYETKIMVARNNGEWIGTTNYKSDYTSSIIAEINMGVTIEEIQNMI